MWQAQTRGEERGGRKRILFPLLLSTHGTLTSDFHSLISTLMPRPKFMTNLKHARSRELPLTARKTVFSQQGILDPSAYGFGNAPVSSGKLCAGVAKIWLFGPHSACSLIQPKRFAYICFIAKCFVASVVELKKFS